MPWSIETLGEFLYLFNIGLTSAFILKLPKINIYVFCLFQVIAKNGTGYLVGKYLTYADVRLCEALLSVIDYFGKCLKPSYINLQVIIHIGYIYSKGL